MHKRLAPFSSQPAKAPRGSRHLLTRRQSLGLGLGSALALGLPQWAGAADAASPSLLGRWQAIDNDTHKPYGVVEFMSLGNSFSGYIRQYIALPGEAPTTVCSPRCPAGKAGQPVLGLEAVWGLRRNADPLQFDDGYAVDPKDGTQLRCKINLKPDGKTLAIRFYMGMPMFGETETWLRLDA